MNPPCRRFPDRTLGPAVPVLAILMWMVPACSPEVPVSEGNPTQADATPSTPKMPSGWKVTADHLFTDAELTAVAQRLGGKLTGLRNTTFEVDGKSVKVNTIIASDATSADAVMARLGAMKPIEFMVRRGLCIYEFVCANDAIPQVREGRKHLVEQ